MKFAVAAVVTLALVVVAQSSVIPLGLAHVDIAGHGLSYTAVSGPAVISPYVHAPVGSVAVHAAAPVHVPAYAPAAVAVHAAPYYGHSGHGVVLGHHAAVVAAPVVGGTYVAKTRGAVHTAPLAGHLNSAAAINVAPAPGTI